jgi:hypothetical protein
MALTIIDFDGYDDWNSQANATIGKYQAFNLRGGASLTWGAAVGRYGAGGATVVLPGGPFYDFSFFQKSLGGNRTGVTLAMAINPTTLSVGTPTNSPIIAEFWDNGVPQVAIAIDNANVYAYRGRSAINNAIGTLIGSAAHGLSAGLYVYLTIQIVFNATTGSVLIQTGSSTTILNLTNVNTDATGNARANVAYHGIGSGNWSTVAATIVFDDTYWADAGGAPLGDMHIDTVVPTSDGGTLQWTPSGGGTHFSMVNELPAEDADATYVSVGASGQTDIYGKGATPGGAANFAAVKVNAIARKTDAGGRNLQMGVISGGVPAVGATHQLGTSYQYFQDIFVNDPNTSAPWASKAAVDAATIEIVSA